MPTDTAPSTAFPSPTTSSEETGSSSNGMSGVGSNRTLVITLSTVLSVVGVLVIGGGLLVCLRYRRRRRLPFFRRGISPIDDDEIATWKISRSEKALEAGIRGGDTDAEAARESGTAKCPLHTKNASTSSAKKPPSVIVYSNIQSQRQSEDRSPPYTGYGKMSFDKVLPQSPIQARAPNARAGLTDEAIPGDDPFLPSPKRHASRLSKLPRAHTRSRSSRSSTRSFADHGYGGSEVGLYTRHSHDGVDNRNSHRVYASSSMPPRLSFDDEHLISPLSPRPLFRDEEIGRAIG
ncbi:hypothetical protein B0T19DRAFT_436824 [Cercophora scortea]|uniref:Uncharacterized protein n=1 Tax=Cercophora scortea TaxID=314031 RepID=A0AAE0J361_9PEZI|nr:hypothetical protein B0T19DRAFT_436824 [Cercophora scortea]